MPFPRHPLPRIINPICNGKCSEKRAREGERNRRGRMRVFFDCDVLLPESERSVKPPTFISFFYI